MSSGFQVLNMSSEGEEVELPDELHTREFALDPYPWYRERRESSRVSLDSDGGFWNVYGYDAAVEVLSDPGKYSNKALAEGGIAFEHTMLSMDPPEHTERRGVVEEFFRPERVDEHEPDVRRRAEELLDDALTDGSLDGVKDLAYPLPIMTICDVLGVPKDEWRRFKVLSDTAVAGPMSTGGDEEALEEARQEAVLDTGRELNRHVQERRANPRDDLISRVVEKDHGMSQYELLRMLGLLMAAGNVTTTNLIGNALWTLTENPEEVARCLEDPEYVSDVVEEALRYRSPVQFTVRRATEDADLRGHEIEAGDSVVVWLAAANRDPAAFDEPEEFRPGRSPNNHLAFGRGPHTCLGASLARMEARVALETMFGNITHLERVDEPLQPTDSTFLYGVENLPLEVET